MKQVSAKEAKKLWESLSLKPVMVWDKLSAGEEESLETLAREYRAFIDACRTERRFVQWFMDQARKSGFVEPAAGRGQGAGKLCINHRGKAGALAWLGERPLSEGIRIIASHVDSPRLDLKALPLYEEADVVFLKSQYYGGIKKYQWLARPLGLVGVVVRADGSQVEVSVGFEPGDPVFTVADLLPHLGKKLQEKKVGEAFEGEKLNLVVGSRPLGVPEVKERFKLHLLKILNDKYGLNERDLISAELEAVPAEGSREVGFDRALIGAYGQDDRACAFSSLKAALDLKKPTRPGICLFLDKEETGSEGATGAQSNFLERVVAALMAEAGEKPSAWAAQEALFHSQALSADVSAAFDPDYPEVHEKRNAARLGLGPCLVKYTGHGGKYSTSDASAEYMGWLRGVLDRAGVIWQAGGLGKVDEGGGGTVAKFLAKYGLEVVDFGMPLLGMHSPFELMSKADLYMTVRGMAAFLEEK